MSEAVDLTMEEFPAFCHEKGMKCTAQRMAMFSALRERRLYPSVDEIWGLVKRTLPTVTRDSVYRILNEFSGHGLLARLDALSAARYDMCAEPHAHFVSGICEN